MMATHHHVLRHPAWVTRQDPDAARETALGLPPEFLRLGPIADDGDVRRARRFFRTQAAEQPPRQSRPLPWRSTQCLSHAREAEPPPPMGEPVEQPDAGDSLIEIGTAECWERVCSYV